jgi:hypothetical protein
MAASHRVECEAPEADPASSVPCNSVEPGEYRIHTYLLLRGTATEPGTGRECGADWKQDSMDSRNRD